MNNYLKSLWLTETVRLIEKENGRFNDDEANRIARNEAGTLTTRLIKRAELLSEQNSLQQVQVGWLNSAKLSMIILLIIALLTGAGLAFSALANNPVNLYWALLCLLGVHFVSLFLWAISCIFVPNESGSLLIHIWLWLANKLSQKKTVSQVLPAFITLFSDKIRWLVGLIVNLLWTVILFSALVILVILLSTKNYSFEWQTTLLSADSVIRLTYLLGWLPSTLGFTLPDTDMIRVSAKAMTDAEIRSAWAIWLLGIFIVYGLGVRITLFIFCWLKWVIGCQNITLNLQEREYQQLANELQPVAVKSIVDQEHQHDDVRLGNQQINKITGSKQYLLAIDMEPSWVPPEQSLFLGFLNNNEQRKSILEFLQQNPAEKLLIAIDTDRSPDRGMLNLIQVLTSKSSQSKLWFVNQGRQFENWQEGIPKLGIEQATPSWLVEGTADA